MSYFCVGCCNHIEYARSNETTVEKGQTMACAWTQYFGKCIQFNSDGDVRFYNLALPGFSSDTFSEVLLNHFHDAGICIKLYVFVHEHSSNLFCLYLIGWEYLTERNIVFIDFSVIDIQYSSSSRINLLENGLENIVRRMIRYTQPSNSSSNHIRRHNDSSDTDSITLQRLPKIILLDFEHM